MIENYSIRVFKQLAIKTTKSLNVRVFYCLKGKSKIIINLEVFDLYQDDVAFVILNDTYSFRSDRDTMCCIIDIPFDLFLRMANQSKLSSGLKIDKNEKGRVKFWILKLLEMHCLPNINKSEANKLILYLIVELSHFATTEKISNSNMYLSEDVHEYLVNYHDRKINKKDLAHAVKISNQTLTSMFKETPFQTFNQYLNHLRLKFCLIDILTTRKPIEEIAIEHGFHHYSRFIQLFKDTYGKTPKLIRKDYITTSIFQNKSEEIDLNQHVLKTLSELKRETLNEIKELHIKVTENPIHYQSPDVYIEHIKNEYISHLNSVNLKRSLDLNRGTIFYIIDLNYDEIIPNSEGYVKELSQILQFISNQNMFPIFKISTLRKDVFNSTEKMSFNQAMEKLFILLRRFNHLQIGFLVEGVTLSLINQLRRSIDRYFDGYQLIYRPDKSLHLEVDLSIIETKVDKMILPIEQTENLVIDHSKLIIDVNHIIKNKECLLSESIINNVKQLMFQYDKMSGLSLPYIDYEVSTDIAQQQLNGMQLIISVINMFNQLRGDIVFKNNQMVMARYKHEYQVITYFFDNDTEMNVNQYRLIFSDIKQLNHADIEYIDVQRYAMNENNSLERLLIYHQHYWLAKKNYKEVTTSSIDIPKDSIAHIKFLVSL